MKVVIVGPLYPFRGGIAHFGGCLYKELQRQGYEVAAVNFDSQYPPFLFPGKSQTEKNSYFKDIISSRILTPYNPVSFYPAFIDIISHNPDLVIFNYFIPLLAPAYTYLLKRINKKGIKSLLLAHNLTAHENWFLSDYLTRKMLQHTAYLLTLSAAVYQEACTLLPRKKVLQGFHPLYDFHNRNRFTPAQAKQELDLTGKKVILFFGYIKPYKGLDILLKAFPRIKEKLPQAVLLIVGEIYGKKTAYHQLISQAGSEQDIILHDKYVSNDDVEVFFKAADVLALPYRSATQSGIIQIAYSCDTGVVVTPVGGLPEMVVPGKTGIISRQVDEESFADALIEFFALDDKQVEQNIIEYKADYSWSELVNLLATFYTHYSR